MVIVSLSREHKQALLDFTTEFIDAGEEHIPGFLPDPEWTFEQTVRGFEDQSNGVGLPESWVPATTRFLTQDGRIFGVFNLRHRLTDGLRQFGGHVGYSVRPSERRHGHGTTLLRAAIELAKELGIEELLVTCDRSNVASAGVIVRCGGRLEDCWQVEDLGEICRYWIDLTAPSAQGPS